MRCTNEFYEGKLTRGLTQEQQDEKKQHGFHLQKAIATKSPRKACVS